MSEGSRSEHQEHKRGWIFMQRYEYLLIYVAVVVTISLILAFLDG